MTYVVVSASAKMPSSCMGQYARVGVVELEPGFTGQPKMLSARARGVRRIVRTWERQHVGRTERCAFARARREAEELAHELNQAEGRRAAASPR